MTGGRRFPRDRQGTTSLLKLHLKIEALAKGGEGLAHVQLEGRSRAVLVPRSAPGDVVEAQVHEESGILRAVRFELLESSPDRVTPACGAAHRCGGCDLGHLTLQAQRLHREALVRQILARVLERGIAGDVPNVRTHHAEQTEGYRSRVRVGIEASLGRVVVGFRARRSRALVEVDRCLVATAEIDQARREIPSWLAGSLGSGDATIQRGCQQLPTLSLTWQGDLSAEVFSRAAQLVDTGQWAGVEVRVVGAREPAVIGAPEGVMLGVDGQPLLTAPGGFMQAHEGMSSRLVTVVAKAVPEGAACLELFCGSGNITIALASRTANLQAVEGDAGAVRAARRNLSSRGLAVKLVEADANQFLIPSATRAVVLDPPRTGAAEACKRIAESRVRRVVMVSCDPATLARDLQLVCGRAPEVRFSKRQVSGSGQQARHVGSKPNWRVLSLDVFEMFPHTSHAETVVVLDRTKGVAS